MAQQPEIVPKGNIAEKYDGPVTHRSEATHRLELILVALVALVLVATFAMLVLGSIESIQNANKYIPTAVPVK